MPQPKLSKLKLKAASSSSAGKSNAETPRQISIFFAKTTEGSNDTVLNVNNDPELLTNQSNAQTDAEKTAEKKIIEKSRKRQNTKTPAISNFLNKNHNDSLADFDVPKKARTVRPPVKNVPAKSTKKSAACTSKSRKRQVDIRKIINRNLTEDQLFTNALTEHCTVDQVDADQLQMAMALSRSLVEVAGGDDKNNQDEFSLKLKNTKNLDQQEQQMIIRHTLEKFGFNSNSKRDYDFNQFFGLNKSKKQKWSSKYTQLTRRNQQRQDAKLNSRIETILRLNKRPDTFNDLIRSHIISSRFLSQFYMPEKILFTLNSSDVNVDLNSFYTNNLCEPTTVKCGCLLKDWSKIPGRSITPDRAIHTDGEKDNILCGTKSSYLELEGMNKIDKISREEKEIYLPETVTNDRHCGSLNEHTASNESVEYKELNSQTSYITQSNRDTSPDIFGDSDDDMVNSSMDKSSLKSPLKQTKDDCSQILTKCINTEFLSNQGKDIISSGVYLKSSNLELESMNKFEKEDEPSNTEEKEIDFPIRDTSPDLFANSDDDMTDPSTYKSPLKQIDANTSPKSKAIDLNTSKVSDCSEEDKNEIVFIEKFSSGNEDEAKSGIDGKEIDDEEGRQCFSNEIIEILSSDSSDYGEPSIRTTTNETPGKSINFSPMKSPIEKVKIQNVKDLSFIDRLELYNKDSMFLDEQFSQKSNEIHNSQESIVISDDEVNYSVNYEWDSCQPSKNYQKTPEKYNQQNGLNCESAKQENDNYVDLSQNSDENSTSNCDDLLKVFDETLCNTSPLKCSQNTEDQFLNETIKDILVKDFSFNRKTSKNGNESGTKFRRTVSNMEMTSHPRSLKFIEFLDDTMVYSNVPIPEVSEIEDQFDRMVTEPAAAQPQIEFNFDLLAVDNTFLPPRTPSPVAVSAVSSPKAPSDDHFEVNYLSKTFFVKTGNITPKPDYDRMDSPTRLIHLKKYGLKPLKKRKAVICLEHIYNRLHPFIEVDESAAFTITQTLLNSSESIEAMDPPVKLAKRPKQILNLPSLSAEFNVESVNLNSCDFEAYNASIYDWFLPSAPRAKKPWCLQPLHIAWYNLIRASDLLHELILEYKPIDLMKIRRFFKDIGLLYEVNDLIGFFDRHCITFRTENNRKNK